MTASLARGFDLDPRGGLPALVVLVLDLDLAALAEVKYEEALRRAGNLLSRTGNFWPHTREFAFPASWHAKVSCHRSLVGQN